MKKLILFTLFAALFTFSCKKDDVTPVQTNGNNVTTNKSIVPNDFLSAQNYDKLIIQIQAVNGFQITDATISNLTAFLQSRLNKPTGIEVVKSYIASPGKAVLSLDDLQAIEKSNRTQYPDGRTLTAYFFIADGDYSGNSGDSKVLGIAYSPTSMVLFEKTMREYTGGLGKPSLESVETTVIEHEFGHILGLVNNGTSMQTSHQDEAHGKHCNDEKCLMNWSVETSDAIANLLGNNIPILDANCLNDLKANGGK